MIVARRVANQITEIDVFGQFLLKHSGNLNGKMKFVFLHLNFVVNARLRIKVRAFEE